MSERVHPQVGRLIERVKQNTDRNQVRWKLVGDGIHLQLEHGSLAITPRDGDGQPPFVLQVIAPDGTVVESLETADGWITNDRIRINLWELYAEARRAALGVSGVIDAMMNELPNDDIPF